MKLIPLTQGQFAQVDGWNYDWLNQWKWYAYNSRGIWYARRNIDMGYGGQTIIHMHRIIMNTPEDLEVDHRDRNGLNNLEENMHNCTHQQNMLNRQVMGKSKYRGVYFEGPYIRAQIVSNKQRKFLGTFLTEELAALAYDVAAKQRHGEFANLNFK